MSRKICQYRGHSSSCNKDNIVLPTNIPELPWGRQICIINDVSACSLGRSGGYINWKTNPTTPQVIPVYSRPPPSNRNWRAPVRPLPQISNIDACNSWPPTPNCDQTQFELDFKDITSPKDLNEGGDYLQYNNPNAIVDNGNLISCQGGPSINFYSGPGWKASRVHGRSKSSALPRPIKHWRKQLFPRQYVDSDGFPINNLSQDPNQNPNTRSRKRSLVGLFDRPGEAIITDYNNIKDSKNELINCIPIYIPINSDVEAQKFFKSKEQITWCEMVALNSSKGITDYISSSNTCNQQNALKRVRHGANIPRNNYVYHSFKGYLKNRVKLYSQNTIFQFNLIQARQFIDFNNKYNRNTIFNSNELPKFGINTSNTVSLYIKNKPILMDPDQILPNETCISNPLCNPGSTNIGCSQLVSFAPSNRNFSRNGAVSSNTNIRRIKNSTISRNQYNVTNKFGIITGGDTTYESYTPYTQRGWLTRAHRRYSGNSGGGPLSNWCCPFPPAPPIEYDPATPYSREGDWRYIFWGDYLMYSKFPTDQKSAKINQDIMISQAAFYYSIPVSKKQNNYLYLTNKIIMKTNSTNGDVGWTNQDQTYNGALLAYGKYRTFVPEGSLQTPITLQYNGTYLYPIRNTNALKWYQQRIGDQLFTSFITNYSKNQFLPSKTGYETLLLMTDKLKGLSGITGTVRFCSDPNKTSPTSFAGLFEYCWLDENQIDPIWRNQDLFPLNPINQGDPQDRLCMNNLTDVNSMFAGCLCAPAMNLTDWQTQLGTADGNIKDMSSMFDGCGAKIELNNANNKYRGLSKWTTITANCTNMNRMFHGNNQWDEYIGAWHVSNVIDMAYMFSYANVYNNDSNLNKNFKWKPTSCTTMNNMFSFTNQFSRELVWYNVTQALEYIESMFESAKAFNELVLLNTNQITDYTNVFKNASVFTNGSNIVPSNQASYLKDKQTTGSQYENTTWNTQNGTDFTSMFENAHKFNMKVLNDQRWPCFFHNSSNQGGFNRTYDINAPSMFSGAKSFNPQDDNTHPFDQVGNWYINKFTNMEFMFSPNDQNCEFNQDINNWAFNMNTVLNLDHFIGTDHGGSSEFSQQIFDWTNSLKTGRYLSQTSSHGPTKNSLDTKYGGLSWLQTSKNITHAFKESKMGNQNISTSSSIPINQMYGGLLSNMLYSWSYPWSDTSKKKNNINQTLDTIKTYFYDKKQSISVRLPAERIGAFNTNKWQNLPNSLDPVYVISNYGIVDSTTNVRIPLAESASNQQSSDFIKWYKNQMNDFPANQTRPNQVGAYLPWPSGPSLFGITNMDFMYFKNYPKAPGLFHAYNQYAISENQWINGMTSNQIIIHPNKPYGWNLKVQNINQAINQFTELKEQINWNFNTSPRLLDTSWNVYTNMVNKHRVTSIADLDIDNKVWLPGSLGASPPVNTMLTNQSNPSVTQIKWDVQPSFGFWIKTHLDIFQNPTNTIFKRPVTSMRAMFWNCKFGSYNYISDWDVSGVTDMAYMFYDCDCKHLKNINAWNQTTVTTIEGMFSGRAPCTYSDNNQDMTRGWLWGPDVVLSNQIIANLDSKISNACERGTMFGLGISHTHSNQTVQFNQDTSNWLFTWGISGSYYPPEKGNNYTNNGWGNDGSVLKYLSVNIKWDWLYKQTFPVNQALFPVLPPWHLKGSYDIVPPGILNYYTKGPTGSTGTGPFPPITQELWEIAHAGGDTGFTGTSYFPWGTGVTGGYRIVPNNIGPSGFTGSWVLPYTQSQFAPTISNQWYATNQIFPKGVLPQNQFPRSEQNFGTEINNHYIGDWNTENVTSMKQMFAYNTKLTGITNNSKYKNILTANQPQTNFFKGITSFKCTDMSEMFLFDACLNVSLNDFMFTIGQYYTNQTTIKDMFLASSFDRDISNSKWYGNYNGNTHGGSTGPGFLAVQASTNLRFGLRNNIHPPQMSLDKINEIIKGSRLPLGANYIFKTKANFAFLDSLPSGRPWANVFNWSLSPAPSDTVWLRSSNIPKLIQMNDFNNYPQLSWLPLNRTNQITDDDIYNTILSINDNDSKLIPFGKGYNKNDPNLLFDKTSYNPDWYKNLTSPIVIVRNTSTVMNVIRDHSSQGAAWYQDTMQGETIDIVSAKASLRNIPISPGPAQDIGMSRVDEAPILQNDYSSSTTNYYIYAFWTYGHNHFLRNKKLGVIDVTSPVVDYYKNNTNVLLTDTQYMFRRCHVGITNIPSTTPNKFMGQDTFLKTNKITTMRGMFLDSTFCDSPSVDTDDYPYTGTFSPPNSNSSFASWNTNEVTDMSEMFRGTTDLTQDINTSSNQVYWNVSNVTFMNQMFMDSDFNENINRWDTTNVSYMNAMFRGAKEFDQNINTNSTQTCWNVSNVTFMNQMFMDSIKFNKNINLWDTNKVSDMSQMFMGAKEFDQNINTNSNQTFWNVSNVTFMNQMFSYNDTTQNECKFNQNINQWKPTSVSDISKMFYKNNNFGNQNLDNFANQLPSHTVKIDKMFYFDFNLPTDPSPSNEQLCNFESYGLTFGYNLVKKSFDYSNMKDAFIGGWSPVNKGNNYSGPFIPDMPAAQYDLTYLFDKNGKVNQSAHAYNEFKSANGWGPDGCSPNQAVTSSNANQYMWAAALYPYMDQVNSLEYTFGGQEDYENPSTYQNYLTDTNQLSKNFLTPTLTSSKHWEKKISIIDWEITSVTTMKGMFANSYFNIQLDDFFIKILPPPPPSPLPFPPLSGSIIIKSLFKAQKNNKDRIAYRETMQHYKSYGLSIGYLLMSYYSYEDISNAYIGGWYRGSRTYENKTQYEGGILDTTHVFAPRIRAGSYIYPSKNFNTNTIINNWSHGFENSILNTSSSSSDFYDGFNRTVWGEAPSGLSPPPPYGSGDKLKTGSDTKDNTVGIDWALVLYFYSVYSENMSYLFKNCHINLDGDPDIQLSTSTSGLTSNKYITDWDTSNVTNMSYMFQGSTFYGNLSSFTGNSWKLNKCTNFQYMFANTNLSSTTSNNRLYDMIKDTNNSPFLQAKGASNIPSDYEYMFSGTALANDWLAAHVPGGTIPPSLTWIQNIFGWIETGYGAAKLDKLFADPPIPSPPTSLLNAAASTSNKKILLSSVQPANSSKAGFDEYILYIAIPKFENQPSSPIIKNYNMYDNSSPYHLKYNLKQQPVPVSANFAFYNDTTTDTKFLTLEFSGFNGSSGGSVIVEPISEVDYSTADSKYYLGDNYTVIHNSGSDQIILQATQTPVGTTAWPSYNSPWSTNNGIYGLAKIFWPEGGPPIPITDITNIVYAWFSLENTTTGSSWVKNSDWYDENGNQKLIIDMFEYFQP